MIRGYTIAVGLTLLFCAFIGYLVYMLIMPDIDPEGYADIIVEQREKDRLEKQRLCDNIRNAAGDPQDIATTLRDLRC